MTGYDRRTYQDDGFGDGLLGLDPRAGGNLQRHGAVVLLDCDEAETFDCCLSGNGVLLRLWVRAAFLQGRR